MRIIILGGSGFVGRNLTHALEKTRHDVFSFSRRTGLDVLDFPALFDVFQEIQPDVIVHCAAHFGTLRYLKKFAADIFHENVTMALNIYRAVQKTCPQARIVNLLSNCSYPGNTDIQQESDWCMGAVHESVFPYGTAKRSVYSMARSYKIQYALQSVNFLVPNTFGPGDHSDPERVHALNGIIMRMIAAHRKRDATFDIWGTGKPVREWLYIDDLVAILERSFTIDADMTYPVNIAQNKGYSIKESATFVAEAIGFEGALVFNTNYPDGDPKKVMSDALFRKIFPDVVFTDHREAIQKTIAYYLSIL